VCDVAENILDYRVIEPDVNLSDHLPIVVRCKYTYSDSPPITELSPKSKVKQLRWDLADLVSYYTTTMRLLYSIY